MKLALLTLMICAAALMPARAAELSPTLPDILSSASATDQIAVIVFLDSKLSMDEVYPEAKQLPMGPRREYVVRVLKERFALMSPDVMKYLEGFTKTGDVSLLRPLWIMNAIRLTATRDVLIKLASDFPEVIYVAHDPVYENTLDTGWGVAEIGAPQVWSQFGARGQGVIVGHKDSGINFAGCARFADRIWMNLGEDVNHDGQLDGADQNGVDDDGNGYIDDFNGWNFDDNTNTVSDNNGHGTRTGSVISSNPTTGTCDTVSVAPQATLMVLLGYLTQGAVFESSQYALENGANVISASLSFKQSECNSPNLRECPNRVGFRWVSEMELAAGIIHANSTGNDGLSNPRPLSTSAPSDCPPPAMTPGHYQQGGVSSVVAVGAYNANGTHGSFSGIGPSAWSRQDICVHPRVPWCGPEGTPSEYPEEFEDYPYASGEHGLLKPDITAPTVVDAVASTCGCSSINGTSGATPHVGGALAVIYSAFPGITPEEAYLVLVNGALDAGDAGPDTTWGFGKLRLLSAIQRGDDTLGSVAGTVSESPSGDLLEGVRVTVEGAQPVWTDANGNYELFLRPGTYTGAYEKFGYQTVLRNINIIAGQVDDGNLTLSLAADASVSVVVTDGDEVLLQDVLVRHPLSGQETFTNFEGIASFPVMYSGINEFIIGENVEMFERLSITPSLQAGQNTVPAELERSRLAGPTLPDQYGYIAYDDLDFGGPFFDWVELSEGLGDNLNISGDGCASRTLPFNLQFYGAQTNQINISANGHVEFGTPCSQDWSRWPIPAPDAPNNYISVFWQDYRPELGGGVYYHYDAENHRAIVQWEDVPEWFETGRATFQVHIYDPAFNGDHLGNSVIEIHFEDYQGRLETSIGIENASGTDGLQYAFQLFYAAGAAPVRAGRAIRFTTDVYESADDGPGVVPRDFVLMQNYPNPFNSTTTFRLNVPQVSQVSLKLYDVTGRETAVITDGTVQAGTHSVNFNATGLSTGIYFVRMEANGSTVAARKILFLK